MCHASHTMSVLVSTRQVSFTQPFRLQQILRTLLVASDFRVSVILNTRQPAGFKPC